MPQLLKQNDGVVLSVKAQPGARRNGITGLHDGALKVAVTAAPEKGKANRAILDVLSNSLGLRKTQIELLAGATSQQKRFIVRGVEMDELQRRIAAALPKAH